MAANSYRNVFLTNLDTILATGNTTLALGIGEIGIVDPRTNTSTTSPAFPANRSIQIVQGNTDKKLPKGMMWGNQTLRSPEIPADPNIKFEVLKGQKAQNMIVTLGYDGADTTKTLAPREGKEVRVYLTLTGQPIANLVANTGNHPASITETFDLILPCITDCADNCDDTVNCTTVADAIIDQMSVRKVIGGIQLVDGVDGEPGLIKITKLVTSCTTPSSLPTVDCQKWELSVSDAGDQVALGAVQAQYPASTVTKKDRVGIVSTYELALCDGSTPADFVENGGTLIPNCTTCPSGYTFVPEYNVFTIVRAGNVTAATMATAYAAVAIFGSVVKLSYANGQSTFQIYSDSNLAGVQAVVSTDVVTASGIVQDICQGNEGLTTAWAEGDECHKASKNYQLTLKDTICGTSRLAELEAIYGEDVTIQTTNAATCTRVYRLAVLSNESCKECGSQTYTWTPPAAFGGQVWIEVASQDDAGVGCVCGLRFESAYVARERKECYFEDVSAEVEPLFLYLSTNNPDFRDYSTLCNDDEAFPVTLVQEAKYRQGWGSDIAEQVKQSNFYFNKPWYSDPAVRDAVGYELQTDLQGYYDQFTLVFREPVAAAGNFSGFGLSQFQEYEFTVYTPMGSGTSLQQAINSWLSSFGGQTNHT